MLKYREILEKFENIHGEYQRIIDERKRKIDEETWHARNKDVNQAFVKEVEQWLNAHEEDITQMIVPLRTQ